MKNKLRYFLWKLLGINFYKFLKHQNVHYLKDLDFVSWGEGSYDNGAKVWFWSKSPTLSIGKYCSIATDVNFILDSGYHNIHSISTFPFVNELFEKEEEFVIKNKTLTKRKYQEQYNGHKNSMKIGNDVWIGMGVTLLPGVTIGDGAVCLGNSVVSKDVPAYAIVAGVPGKIVGYRFTKEIIESLLQIRWWEWTKEIIKERIDDFHQPIEEFSNKYGEK